MKDKEGGEERRYVLHRQLPKSTSRVQIVDCSHLSRTHSSPLSSLFACLLRSKMHFSF